MKKYKGQTNQYTGNFDPEGQRIAVDLVMFLHQHHSGRKYCGNKAEGGPKREHHVNDCISFAAKTMRNIKKEGRKWSG